MAYNVKFIPQNREIMVDAGTTILDAEIRAGLDMDAPCGGKGLCGKCKVRIEQSGDPALQSGSVVLACQTSISADIIVDTLQKEEKHRILTDGMKRKVSVDTVGLASQAKFLMAFDIGTTTVVGYLIDRITGLEVCTVSRMNPQHIYGADVISRANYVLENGQNGQDALSGCIRSALQAMMQEACQRMGASVTEIAQISIVGNTCMHHLLLGVSPDSLVHAPYVPAIREAQILKPEELQLTMDDRGRVLLFPNIAGFVGGDTVGCLVSLEFDRLEPMTLLVDIGTNGEMALGNKKRIMATSTAAGPAFEGAKIECGMRGSEGAISHLTEMDDHLELEIVGGGKAKGICGSGLIDVIAYLIRRGFINSMGGFRDADDLDDPEALRESARLIEKNRQPAFLLVDKEKSATGEDIYISQKDVREVQLAKGAIAAGIEILANKLGIQTDEIEQVYLAGAFGNYMNAQNACEIGMIPVELKDRITAVGNAAGEGSKLAVCNSGEYEYASKLATEAEFVELAAEKDFQDIFVDQLEFALAVED